MWNKKIFLCYLLMLVGMITDADERRIKIGTVPELTLGTGTEIVLPEKSTPTARFAAKELQYYLSRSLRRDLPIIQAPSGRGVVLIVGDNEFARQLGVNAAELERDAFRIKSSGQQIVIAGKDDPQETPENFRSDLFERGTLFGVYDFLERFAGVRFYFPGEIGTVVPNHSEIKLGTLDILDRPDHTARRVSSGACKWYDYSAQRDGVFLQNYRNRMQTAYVPNCHSLERSGYLERFGKSHPEYFALDERGNRYLDQSHPSVGSLCLSNPGFRNELFLDARSYLKGEPAKVRGVLCKGTPGWDGSAFRIGYFNIMPGDYHRQCQCANCLDYQAKYGASSLVWDLVASTAERLQEAQIPGKITAMAYAYYRTVPRRQLPDNVEVMVAVTGPWADRDVKLRQQDDQLIADWNKKLGKKVWIWTYPNKYGASELPGIPAMAPKTIGYYYQRVAPMVFGSYMECETDQWIFNYLNMYVYGKVSWDHGINLEALLAEHYEKMFGPAATPMREFYETLEQIWVNRLLGKMSMTALGPVNVPPSNYEIWENIYSKVELKKLSTLFDQAEKLAATDQPALERIKFMRLKLLQPIQHASELYWKEKKALVNWTFYVKKMGDAEKIIIDGQLNEPAWQASEMIFLLPLNGGKSEVNTTVRARLDDRYLYLGFECMEPAMDRLIVRQQQRDHADVWRDSEVEIFLNPSDDGKEYYHFMINADGVVADAAARKAGASSQFDNKWNSQAQVKANRSSDRWTLEIAIPLAELQGFNPKGFKANFGRHRVLAPPPSATTLYTWSPFVSNFHDVGNFGKLVFEPSKEISLVTNGDFIAPLKGNWYYDPAQLNNSIFLDDQVFMTGGRSLRFNGSGTFKVHQDLPQLKPDTTYALSFYVRLDDVKPLKTGGGVVVMLGDNQNNWFPKLFYNGTMPWTRQGFLWKTRPDTNRIPARKASIRLYMFEASGTVWFDDVRLVETTPDQTGKD